MTEARAEEVAEDAVRRARGGRPSLTGGGKRSPQIAFRVPESLAERAAEEARREGKTVSQLGRDALEDYLDRIGA
ncbi:hypothetical protein BJF85_05500 [Saccharomonospora sp. CUA-673]|nr:hypothetical protein BJF85_05500 [Saccharomonospora sp. CUA-673]